MKCPFCRQTTSDVFNSRPTRFDTQIWRRRRCLSCHQSFTTYEQVDLGFLKVVRSGKPKQRYSRAKLFASLYAAFLNIPSKAATIDAITETIESKILDTGKREISSAEVARIVLATLKRYHTTAFVRYLADQTDLVSDAQLKHELKKY